MDRIKFIKNLGFGALAVPMISTSLISCSKDDDETTQSNPGGGNGNCLISPIETAGPFPIMTPADYVRANIVGDRSGVPLMMKFIIQNTNDDCKALEGAFVDIWQCDAKGNYSEYDGQLDGDFTNKHFLRGRQTTNGNGVASFISVYPGWYPGRAPHLHLEILKSSGSSLLITQVAFPENISNAVYATQGYNGNFDTSNTSDGIFNNSIAENMADTITGNPTDGYVLTKTIKVMG